MGKDEAVAQRNSLDDYPLLVCECRPAQDRAGGRRAGADAKRQVRWWGRRSQFGKGYRATKDLPREPVEGRRRQTCAYLAFLPLPTPSPLGPEPVRVSEAMLPY